MQLSNDQHACVFVFVPVEDISNIPCDYPFIYLYLINFMFQTMLDAVDNMLAVYCRSI